MFRCSSERDLCLFHFCRYVTGVDDILRNDDIADKKHFISEFGIALFRVYRFR